MYAPLKLERSVITPSLLIPINNAEKPLVAATSTPVLIPIIIPLLLPLTSGVPFLIKRARVLVFQIVIPLGKDIGAGNVSILDVKLTPSKPPILSDFTLKLVSRDV